MVPRFEYYGYLRLNQKSREGETLVNFDHSPTT